MLPGHRNEDVQFTVGDIIQNTTVKEKDFGVMISADMQVSKLCRSASSKENYILGSIT